MTASSWYFQGSRRDSGGLHSLEIALGAPVKALAEAKAAQAELGRCLAVACSAGAVRRLTVRWLGKTKLKLGPELAACGAAASVRSLVIDGGPGYVHVACPLGRLTALQHCELALCTKWDGAACLPPSLTSMVLRNVCNPLSVLSSLRQFTLSVSPSVPHDGFKALSVLTSLTSLALHDASAWPTALQQLTGLKYLEVSRMSGQWWLAGLPHEAALSASAQQVLAALNTLTALHFHGKVTPPTNPAAALAGAAQLQLLCDKTHPAVFGPDAWPDGLRCACIYWVQLADGRWSAGFGEQLRYLRIDSWMEDWSAMQRHPAWSAFWAWATQAADLRLVEITGYHHFWELPMALSQALMTLRQRRPQLTVTTRVQDLRFQGFLATAAAFCT
ncbi:hypothetical protein COHA_002716 [Chlorella ohadii]|uniref:Uncharacterized protein n=1 Tax=Chlorella ohadii TaxID=2649997 RepID=A0AAD5DWF6_9CHLO|nr:hypothetical protein COHA_002716 [Chlorella ohadii]